MNSKLNDNETKGRLRQFVLVAISLFVICAALPTGAATLDAKAARNVISGHTLQIKFTSGTVAFWSWGSDGSLCPRASDKDSDCIDKGTWKLDGKRVCYELTWLGETEGFKSHCFRVADHGQGHYEALSDNGLTFWEFSVVE
jgi:hypothetical protein